MISPTRGRRPDERRTIRQDTAGWYVVDGWDPALGDAVVVDGVVREVVSVARWAVGRTAVHLLPDFRDPRCRECGASHPPPSARWCRTRCGLRAGGAAFLRRPLRGPPRSAEDGCG